MTRIRPFSRRLVLTLALSVAALFQTMAQDSALERRRAFRDPENITHKLQSAEATFPSRVVHRGDQVWKLEVATLPKAFTPSYTWKSATYGIDEFNKRTYTSALLILKDDKVVFERYLAGSSPSTRFFGYSLAKSFTSTLIGIALREGLIKDVNEPLTKYLPALTGGPYDGVTIKDALQMLSGVEFMPGEFDWKDESIPAARVYQASLVSHRYRYIEAANTLKRKYPVGTKFSYSDMDAALLGAVIENATGRRLATYMEEKLWKTAGMESDAVWVLDGPPEIGREVAALSFAATLRDYGRFGLLALHRGRANGQQLVPPEWVKAATTPGRAAVDFGKLDQGYALGYGYYWWLLPDGAFTGQGAFGHFVYVAPQANIVIVKHSHWPKEWDSDLENETYAFCNAVAKALN